MKLHKLEITNFRKVKELVVRFPEGLCVIVGENNTGKTTVIDALRLSLFSARDFHALRLNDDDFHNRDLDKPIEISCTFCDLSTQDEAYFQECLVDVGDEKFHAKINFRAEFNPLTGRVNVKSWGGETEGGFLPSNLYDQIHSIYLQPLRDPESGLKPGRNSQIARLINLSSTEAEKNDLQEIVNNSNEQLKSQDSIQRASKDLNDQMAAIAGKGLAQQIDLIFSDSSFSRIVSGIIPQIDALPFSLNGLGYNNLVYTAATLGTLNQGEHLSFRGILIEEPEAHLHPQLQTLLLSQLVEASKGDDQEEKDEEEPTPATDEAPAEALAAEETPIDEPQEAAAEVEKSKPLQIIVTTHSPTLASQAPLDSIVCIHDTKEELSAVSIDSINIDRTLKRKLERYLDATRAELFFARKILMVEGISEALLLPILAKIEGGSLKDSAVTIVNVSGINFNAFLPLFGPGRLPIPVAILTDGDDKDQVGELSNSLLKLQQEVENITSENEGSENVDLSVGVYYGQDTFEHELAKSEHILPVLLEAFTLLRPQLGLKLSVEIDKLDKPHEKADMFIQEFRRSRTRKGVFAQEVAALLESRELPVGSSPEYTKEALRFLGVLNQKEHGNP